MIKKNSNYSFDFVNRLEKEKRVEFFKKFDWSSKISVTSFESVIENWSPLKTKNEAGSFLCMRFDKLFSFDFFMRTLSEESVLDMLKALNELIDEKINEWESKSKLKPESKTKTTNFPDVFSAYIEVYNEDSRLGREAYKLGDFFNSVEAYNFSYNTVVEFINFSKKISKNDLVPKSERAHEAINMFNLMVHSKTHEEIMRLISKEILKDFGPFAEKPNSELGIDKFNFLLHKLSLPDVKFELDMNLNFCSFDGYDFEIIDCFEDILKTIKTKDERKEEKAQQLIDEMKFFSIYFMNPSLEKDEHKNKAIDFLNNLSEKKIIQWFQKISNISESYYEDNEKIKKINASSNYFEVKRVLESRVLSLLEKGVEASLNKYFFDDKGSDKILSAFGETDIGNALKSQNYSSMLSFFEEKHSLASRKDSPWFSKDELTKVVFSKIKESLSGEKNNHTSKDWWMKKMNFLLKISDISMFISVKDEKLKEEFSSRESLFFNSCVKEIAKTAELSWERSYLEVKKDINKHSSSTNFSLGLLCSILINYRFLSKTSASKKIDDAFFSSLKWGSASGEKMLEYCEAKLLEEKSKEKNILLCENKKTKTVKKGYRF